MAMIYVPSPNFTRGRQNYKPIAIVIHIMEGTMQGTDSWFGSPKSQVSAHYGVSRMGDIHRYVLETDTAWHAGRVNNPSWKLLIRAGNGYIADPNYYTIGIEHEGTAESNWTPQMYSASSALIADIAQRWNIPLDRDHVIGHHEIYAIKSCPGDKVNINYLVSLAALVHPGTAAANYTVVAVTGTVRVICGLNIRTSPSREQAAVGAMQAGDVISYTGYTPEGENISTNSKWYRDDQGNWFWGGGVIEIEND